MVKVIHKYVAKPNLDYKVFTLSKLGVIEYLRKVCGNGSYDEDEHNFNLNLYVKPGCDMYINVKLRDKVAFITYSFSRETPLPIVRYGLAWVNQFHKLLQNIYNRVETKVYCLDGGFTLMLTLINYEDYERLSIGGKVFVEKVCYVISRFGFKIYVDVVDIVDGREVIVLKIIQPPNKTLMYVDNNYNMCLNSDVEVDDVEFMRIQQVVHELKALGFKFSKSDECRYVKVRVRFE